MEYIVEIIIAVLALVGTISGSYMANKKTTALIAYRLEQLEAKVNKHNEVIERTYELEKGEALLKERVEHLEHYHQ